MNVNYQRFYQRIPSPAKGAELASGYPSSPLPTATGEPGGLRWAGFRTFKIEIEGEACMS